MPRQSHTPDDIPDDDAYAALLEAIVDQPARWFATNREGILGSLNRVASSEGGAGQAYRFAEAMLELLILTPFSEDRVEVHRLVIEASRRSGDAASHAAALRDLGRAYRDFGRYPEAAEHLQRSIGIYESLGDEENTVGVRLIYAVLLRCVGRTQEAAEVTGDCLRYAEAHDKPSWQAYAWRTLGIVHRDRAEWRASTDAFDRAMTLFRQIGDKHREAICQVHLGSTLRAQGDPGRALDLYTRAGETFAALDFPLWESITLVHRAAVLIDLGVVTEARGILEECLKSFSAIGDLRWVDITEFHLARLELRSGDRAAAVTALEHSTARFRELGEPYSEALALISLARAYNAVGRRADTEHAVAVAVDRAGLIGNPWFADTARAVLAS